MKILIATDGSASALHAVGYAARLVGQMPAADPTLTLISVHDDQGLRHAKSYVGAEAVADYLRELSEEELAPAKALLDAAGIAYRVEIRTGHVAQQIVALAQAGAFDLLVLGAKGRGAIGDLLLGSVAQRVLSTATVPVLLVR